jgi:hypothetical protein
VFWHESRSVSGDFHTRIMKRLAAALFLFLPLTPAVVHAAEAESELTVLRNLRAKVIGKWINGNGEVLSFEENGSLTMESPDPKLPKQLKATYTVTRDARLQITIGGKTMDREYSVDSEALRLKTSTGEFAQYARFTKKAQADFVLRDIRIVDAAIDQWAIEHNKRTGDRPTAADLRQYMPEGSRLFIAFGDPKPKDLLGNSYGELVVDTLPKVHPATAAALADVAPKEFWEQYID